MLVTLTVCPRLSASVAPTGCELTPWERPCPRPRRLRDLNRPWHVAGPPKMLLCESVWFLPALCRPEKPGGRGEHAVF